jgi:hypothetical protein
MRTATKLLVFFTQLILFITIYSHKTRWNMIIYDYYKFENGIQQ